MMMMMWFDSELLVSSRASVIEPDREERKEKLYDDDVTRFDGDRSERWEMKKFRLTHLKGEAKLFGKVIPGTYKFVTEVPLCENVCLWTRDFWVSCVFPSTRIN